MCDNLSNLAVRTDDEPSYAPAREHADQRCCELLGVRVHPVTIVQLNERVERAVAAGGRYIVGCHNLHSVHLFHRDAKMREFYELADDIHIDGMAVVLLARMLGYGVGREHRVTWLDWLDPLMALAAARRWRVFYLGSAPGVAAQAAGKLAERHPGLEMRTRHGYFDVGSGSAENLAARAEINEFRPHLLMVGMGQPRQEEWIRDNAGHVVANAIVTPGACMDYVAGILPAPPRLLGRIGLEWAFRLASEPRRLSRRYLMEPWSLGPLLVSDLIRRVRDFKGI